MSSAPSKAEPAWPADPAGGRDGARPSAPPLDIRRAVGLAAAAMLLYAVFLIEDSGDPSFWHPIIDSEEYNRTAGQIAAGYGAPPQPYWHPPLYPYVLAGMQVLSGSMVVIKVMHALMGVASCLLTWSIGRRLFGERVALIAAILVICWGPLIFFTTQLLPVGLAVLLNLLLLRLLIDALDRPRPWRWLVAGLALGLSAINIPNILVLLPALVLWLLFLAWRQRAWRMVLCAAACGLGTVIPIVPVTARNTIVSGEFIPISTNGGINFYIGNNPDPFRTIAIRPGTAWEQFQRQVEIAGISSYRQADRWFWDKSFTYIRQQPGHFLRHLARKTRLLFNAREVPRNVDVYYFRPYSALLATLTWQWGPIGCPFGLIAPLAALGLIVAWRMNRRSGLLILYLVLYSASVVLFFIAARYRLTIVPVVALLAGCGIVWLCDRIRQRRYGWAAAALAVVVPAAVFVNSPVTAPTDHIDFAAEFQLYLGLRALQHKAYDIAEKQLRRAIELAPMNADAQIGLGNLLLDRGQLSEAGLRYARGLEFSPQCPEALQGLGQIAIRQERWADAVEYLGQALAGWPTNHDARYQRAVALSKMGRIDEAIDQWQAALRRGATDPRHRRALGHALLQTGRVDEAHEQARALLDADADDADALGLLGLVMSARGQWEEAARHLERAVELDEANLLVRLEYARALYEVNQTDRALLMLAAAIKLAESRGETTIAAECRRRAQLYQASRPAP